MKTFKALQAFSHADVFHASLLLVQQMNFHTHTHTPAPHTKRHRCESRLPSITRAAGTHYHGHPWERRTRVPERPRTPPLFVLLLPTFTPTPATASASPGSRGGWQRDPGAGPRGGEGRGTAVTPRGDRNPGRRPQHGSPLSRPASLPLRLSETFLPTALSRSVSGSTG